MLAQLAAKAIDRRHHLRRLVPASRIPALVERRVDRLWRNEAYREAQEGQMRYLLEFTERAPEIPVLARKYAEFQLSKTYTRWHPSLLLNQRFEGIEWLTTSRDRGRCTIVSFLHHNHYEGLFGSLAKAGAPCHVLALPTVLGPAVGTGMRQHIRVVATDSTLIPAEGGAGAIQAQMEPGMILTIAADAPGNTEATFLGRKVLAPIGTAVIATRTNSPIVVASARQDGAGGSYVHLDEPIEPKDFASPLDLFAELLRRHEKTVLAWPEVLDMPRARWGILQE